MSVYPKRDFVYQETCSGLRLCGTVALSLCASAASGQSQAPLKGGGAKYVPTQSIRYDFGSKSTSGYFVEQAAKCVVRMMVYERRDPDTASSSTAMRVRLVLNPGETAALDSEEGHSLNFTCGEGAKALLVEPANSAMN